LQDGSLSQAAHPKCLGSPLTHPYITTDYSESLIELITPVCTSATGVIESLHSLHQFVIQNLQNESLWAASMPCILNGEDNIPVANYGNSNIGKMKRAYRNGLSHRYGKTMQSIAGIHFNLSLSDDFWKLWKDAQHSDLPLKDFKSQSYFRLIRNFYRTYWAILYLFGASPAVCGSFLSGRNHHLIPFGSGTYYLPNATCLRMSKIGYQSEAQSQINISFNGVVEYCESLIEATSSPYPPYEAIGIKRDNEYLQLNSNLLQIENEYYAPIRPKRIARPGEKPTHALREHGVEYIEIRSIDLNPFVLGGIDSTGVLFLELLLLGCLFSDDTPLSRNEFLDLTVTHDKVMTGGRDLDLIVEDNLTITTAGHNLLDRLEPLSELLDHYGKPGYTTALNDQRAKFDTPKLTPSGQILETMTDNNLSFFCFAMEESIGQHQLFSNNKLSRELSTQFTVDAANSIRAQEALEAEDNESFDTFLERYFSS